jgi:hypothetical protein
MIGFLVVLVAGALSAGGTTVKVKVGHEARRMDERGPAVWLVDGKEVQVDRSYFEVDEGELTFAVEWRCPECRRSKPMTSEEALRASRSLLWYAVESGEATRTAVRKVGAGEMKTKHLRSVITYQVEGVFQQITVPVDKLDTLFEWTWVLEGRSYRVFGPGYYFDTDAQRLYFTVKWHDRALCDQLTDITDESAATLAMPLLKYVASRKPFKHIPRVGPAEYASASDEHQVEAIGIEIGCPEPTCAGAVDCPAKGYRVSRTLAQIAAAPSVPSNPPLRRPGLAPRR